MDNVPVVIKFKNLNNYLLANKAPLLLQRKFKIFHNRQ